VYQALTAHGTLLLELHLPLDVTQKERVIARIYGLVDRRRGGLCARSAAHHEHGIGLADSLLVLPEGTCEVDRDKDCVWTLIFERLEKLGIDPREALAQIEPPRDYGKEPFPRRLVGEARRASKA